MGEARVVSDMDELELEKTLMKLEEARKAKMKMKRTRKKMKIRMMNRHYYNQTELVEQQHTDLFSVVALCAFKLFIQWQEYWLSSSLTFYKNVLINPCLKTKK